MPYDLTIPLLAIYPEETRIERDTCTPTFIATLFIIAKGDQPWVFIGRTDVEAETPILWPPDAKS